MAIFEQTTCFFQLVDNLEWNSPTSVTYTTPFSRVMEASQKVGIFADLTEEEVNLLLAKPAAPARKNPGRKPGRKTDGKPGQKRRA